MFLDVYAADQTPSLPQAEGVFLTVPDKENL